MYIFDWISTNVLNFETEKSRAYISNSITGELFWLEKESSDLWYVLLHSKTKDEVVEYAKKRNLIDELPEFLNLLKNLGLCAEEGSAPSANFLTLKRKEVLNNENSKFLNEWSQVNIKEKKITRIQFDVTYGCNERCIHCFCDKDTNDVQITYDKIKPIIDDAYDLGLTQVVFSGGECTLIDDFLEIAKYIKEKRIELVVFTNGQKLYDDEKFFNEFVKLHPFSVGLSLYSMQPEIHDSITQIKGSHHKTLSVIKKLAKSNILVEIKCFLTKYNADCYQEVLEFAKNNNFKIVVDECLQQRQH